MFTTSLSTLHDCSSNEVIYETFYNTKDTKKNIESSNTTNSNNTEKTHAITYNREEIMSRIPKDTYPATFTCGKTTLPCEGTWYVYWTATIKQAGCAAYDADDDNDNNRWNYQTSPPSVNQRL